MARQALRTSALLRALDVFATNDGVTTPFAVKAGRHNLLTVNLDATQPDDPPDEVQLQRLWTSDPSAYPPSTHASATYNGTLAATETRNERKDPEPDWVPDTGTSRTGTGGVFENEGQEFGENDRPGGAGMPGNQGGGRDPGPVPPGQTRESRDSGASAGARAPGNVAAGGSPSPPGTAGRGSG